MCGIAGWLGALSDGDHYAKRLVRALHHRGPDAHGIELWSDATLVHTRLSIIDLSLSGSQPMSNEDGTVWTVFNGEIYNHRELRANLIARGHVFKGRSDTEVIPHLYEEEGPSCISKLQGMFALAIYDARSKKLFLARDRFGIKPLFFAPGSQRLAFASEIRALLELPGIDNRPNRQAIYDFSALFYIPAPETFYLGIRAVQPGEILEARLESDQINWNTKRYYHWSITTDPSLTLDQAVERAETLLAAAVRRQLESDVPLGSLLSGGIDSSLVSEAAQVALGGSLRTFNVRFPDKQYDETWAAQSVADYIGSEHVTLDMNETEGTWGDITDLLLNAGQPFADTSIFAVNAICRMMRKHVSVVLSGDGGDEGFGGYNSYWQIARISNWQALPVPMWRFASKALGFLAPLRFVPAHFPQRLNELAGADDTTIVQNLFSWIRQEEQQHFCRDKNLLPVRRLFEPQWEYHLPSKASRIERLSAQTTEANVRLILPNDFLFKVDTASMRSSLEVRVPMLDENLFSFALSLPYHLKVSGRTCKRVLRAVAKQKLPHTVAAKPKQGFSIPVDRWVSADFKVHLRETLLSQTSPLPEFFNPQVYRTWIEAFCDSLPCPGVSRQGLYQRMVMLLSVHLALNSETQRIPIGFTPLAPKVYH